MFEILFCTTLLIGAGILGLIIYDIARTRE